jgi:hypothetical protein
MAIRRTLLSAGNRGVIQLIFQLLKSSQIFLTLQNPINHVPLQIEFSLLNHFVFLNQVLNFTNSSFPARNTPNQNIFEQIKRTEIEIVVILAPNFKNGIIMIKPQHK